MKPVEKDQYVYKEIYFKHLASINVEAGKSKICKAV